MIMCKPRMNTDKLIQSVRNRPALWDRSDKCYHLREVTRDLWREVSREMEMGNSGSEVVKKRWNNLRDVFRREFRKTLTENADPGQIIWPHYQNMAFLLSQLKPVDKSGTTSKNSNSVNNSSDMYNETVQSSDSLSPLIDMLPPVTKRRRSEELVDPLEDDEYQDPKELEVASQTGNLQHIPSLPMLLADSDDDSDYHFLMSLIPFMKTIPFHRKLLVRTRMQQMLIEESEPQLRQGTDSSSSSNRIHAGVFPQNQASSSKFVNQQSNSEYIL